MLVKTTYAGLCHGDLHQIDGYFPLGGDDKLDVSVLKQLPFCLGHEIEGIVVDMAPGAARCKGAIGVEPCAVYPWGGCRSFKLAASVRLAASTCAATFFEKKDLGNGADMEGGLLTW